MPKIGREHLFSKIRDFAHAIYKKIPSKGSLLKLFTPKIRTIPVKIESTTIKPIHPPIANTPLSLDEIAKILADADKQPIPSGKDWILDKGKAYNNTHTPLIRANEQRINNAKRGSPFELYAIYNLYGSIKVDYFWAKYKDGVISTDTLPKIGKRTYTFENKDAGFAILSAQKQIHQELHQKN